MIVSDQIRIINATGNETMILLIWGMSFFLQGVLLLRLATFAKRRARAHGGQEAPGDTLGLFGDIGTDWTP
jgi:hypothetical protein